MQFRGDRKAPPYFNRRDQLRMLVLVAGMGIVLLAMRVVGRPEFWAGMFPDEEVAEPADRVDPAKPKSDAVHVVRRDGDAPPNGNDDPPEDDPDPAAGTTIPFAPTPPRDWLVDLEDDSIGLKSTEAAAYYGLLSMAASGTLEEIEQASEDTPSRALLMHRPEIYRGRLVTIEGYLKRLTPMTVRDDYRERYGLVELWDGWIAMPDAPERPVHVVFADLADDVPRGMTITRTAKVSVTGWFLKRQGFEGVNGGSRTPLIVAREPRYFPPPVVRGSSEELTPYVIGFAVVIAVSLSAVLLWYRAADRRFGDAHVRHFNEAPEGAIEALEGIETVDPADVMRELAEADAANDEGDEERDDESDDEEPREEQ